MATSGLALETDINRPPRLVRLVANNGLPNQLDVYSITSSAAAMIDAGRLIRSARAVLRLTLIT
jgi:hypothetical protein